MDKEKQDNLFINASLFNIQLNSVNLNYLEPTEKQIEQSLEFESHVNDEFSILKIEDEFIDIELIRKVYLEPKALYDIEITMTISFKLNKNVKKSEDINKLKEEFKKRKKDLLSPATTHASVLISTLTNVSTNELPMVVPPFPMVDNE